MAADSSEDFSSCFYPDCRYSKQVRDNVHGYIYIDPLCLKFVDTEQFQRLRDLKQLVPGNYESTARYRLPFFFLPGDFNSKETIYGELPDYDWVHPMDTFRELFSYPGLTNMVYPGAVHSRFEHCLGVYWLAGEAVHKLRAHQGKELGIENLDVKAVKLAGLLHDIGHGPFSHLFERAFLPRVLGDLTWCHEDMSVKMIDYIVDLHHIDIDSECLKKTKEMIIASTEQASQKKKHFLYDIVANGRNGIDVDKFDYLVRDSRACGLGCSLEFERLMDTMRVMDDEICYRAKDYLTVHKLFVTRAEMHRTVYAHAKVKAIDLMVVDALEKANDKLQISSLIDEPDQFWTIDDSILKTIEISKDPELKEARDLILRIRRRDLYQYCNKFTVPKDKMEHFKDVTPQDVVCSQTSGNVTLNEEDVAVSNVKIDLTRGESNPLESVNFFEDYETATKFRIPEERVTHLMPAYCRDTIVTVYSKKPELVDAVSEAFVNFQIKKYGIKAQVHDTPNKKKYRKLFFC